MSEAWTRERAIETARKVAGECGYAVGVHGSLRRDVDLIAVPWQEEVCSASALATLIAAAVDGWIKEANVVKPHGRRGFSIYPRLLANEPGPPWYIDLSVMPKQRPSPMDSETRGTSADGTAPAPRRRLRPHGFWAAA